MLHGLSFGLALLLVQAVNAQNVSIDLTPITYPIVLPDSGGSFDYLLTVTNQGGSPITATVWCMATLPNGTSWGPALGPVTETLGAGQSQSFQRTQNVPPRAPYGYYTFHAYVGIYPDTIWSQDQFELQHQAVSGTEQEWVTMYDGPGNGDDQAKALTLDGSGNVYVTGRSWGEGTAYDYATIKYNAAGESQWVARYNGPGNGGDVAYSLAIDDDGNVYVTGVSTGNGTSYDYATVKYDASGTQLWAARYNGLGNSYDDAYCLAVDRGGRVYVTGTSYGSGTSFDYATIKYDTFGTQIWMARYSAPGNNYDIAVSLAIDGCGNVYVTGYSFGMGTNTDYATVKYDSSGNQIWVARYNGPESGSDEARSMAVDGGGNVYVTGYSYGTGANHDYATVKYDSSGNQIWVARYNGPGSGSDEARSIAVDSGGHVYVTGSSYGGIESYYDYATVKYDASGDELWVARYNGSAHGYDEAFSLAVDGGGNVYATGKSGGTGTYYYDYATIKYDASGNEVWVARYNGSGNYDDEATSVAVDGTGNAHVTGSSYCTGTYYDYATIKYSGGEIANWMPVEATVFGQSAWGGPQECRLEENFPNPFNASTVLSYQLPVASSVRFRVYDTAGRLVATLVDGWRSAGEHELTWDAGDLPSGMYFAKLQAGEYVGVQKMVLIK